MQKTTRAGPLRVCLSLISLENKLDKVPSIKRDALTKAGFGFRKPRVAPRPMVYETHELRSLLKTRVEKGSGRVPREAQPLEFCMCLGIFGNFSGVQF